MANDQFESTVMQCLNTLVMRQGDLVAATLTAAIIASTGVPSDVAAAKDTYTKVRQQLYTKF